VKVEEKWERRPGHFGVPFPLDGLLVKRTEWLADVSQIPQIATRVDKHRVGISLTRRWRQEERGYYSSTQLPALSVRITLLAVQSHQGGDDNNESAE
jgi:hypothetical protein